MFTLGDVPAGSNLVFVGTGTGLAPYMSMLRGEVDCSSAFQTAVLLGAYNSWDLGYHGELIAMQRFCSNFHYFPTISAPQQEIVPWSGPAGFVQDLWEGGVLEKAWGHPPSPERTHVLLCGNPGMIERMMELLGKEGYREHTKKSPGQIHVEKYW